MNTKYEDPYEQIVMMTILLWGVCLNGYSIGSKIYEYMKKSPNPGDLVLEMSTAYKRIYDHKKHHARFDSGGLGFFIKKTREPVSDNAEEWDPEPIPTEEVWYIRSIQTDQELRWTNCMFVRVPTIFEDELR